MSDVTLILAKIEAGAPQAVEELLQVVYAELRQLAAFKLGAERPGQTLQATALVHEAYLRLVGDAEAAPRWENRRHFFGAAGEAMRRILVDAARSRNRLKRGGGVEREELAAEIAAPEPAEDLLAVDAALEKLTAANPAAAELVRLRYFAGLSSTDAAETLQISPRSADRLWAYAKAWLHRELQG